MGRQVDGADSLSAAVEHRHGECAQATLEFFVDDGESLFAVVADAVEQRLKVGDGLRRVGLDALGLQPPPDLGFIQIAEQDAAERRMHRRQPAADRQRRRHDAPGRHARDIDDVVALQDRGRAGLAEPFAEFAHQGLRAVDPALASTDRQSRD